MLSWSNFVVRHPGGHLIVASISTDGDQKATALRVRSLKTQLGRLLGQLGLDGDYATMTERANGCAEIHTGFEKGADADRLARTVQATATGRYPTWASPAALRPGRAHQRGDRGPARSCRPVAP